MLTRGIFEKHRLLELIRHFIVFEDDGEGALIKKMAGYHQYHAVRKVVETTVRASGPEGDRRAGVVWHTQGSGKSLTMVFFTGKIVLHQKMENPTIVVLTDRNDLDDQLFGTFSRCHELLRQKPVQAEDRPGLAKLLAVASGGIVFTTIQKFSRKRKEKNIRLFPKERISLSSQTKPIGASTTLLTDSPGTYATHCQTRPSLVSPGRRSNLLTRIRRMFLEITSVSTTFREPWMMVQR